MVIYFIIHRDVFSSHIRWANPQAIGLKKHVLTANWLSANLMK